MNSYRYRGQQVFIPPRAEVSRVLLPDGEYAAFVEEILEGVAPWRGQEGVIETVTGFPEMPLLIVLTPSAMRQRINWGKHRKHTASAVQLSPFVEAPYAVTNAITIELVGTLQQPTLVRAYPGEYSPPLPWQRSAPQADGGMQACVKYWSTHAYAYHPSVVDGNATNTRPDWAKVLTA